jgi:tRNA (guanine37-N1)-methyltransferase
MNHTSSESSELTPQSALNVSLIALFPEIVEPNVSLGITGRAKDRGLWRYQPFPLRDFAFDPRKTVDARPAGGGAGMVLMQAPLERAVVAAKSWHGGDATVILLAPDGEQLTQSGVQRLLGQQNLIFVAGRYEGVDQRWIDRSVDQSLSIGDYILSGGELAAAVVIDAMVRLIPGALGDQTSALTESFSTGLLDWPQYALTNAAGNADIPAVLQGGNHALIDRWRREAALKKTLEHRPDLIVDARKNGTISKEDEKYLRSLGP